MVSQADDMLEFAPDPEDQSSSQGYAWNILIVDDEESIHEVTRMVLTKVEFEGYPLHFLSAYSAAEGRALMAEWGDRIAIAIIDVVMEEEHSGLELVKYTREQLGNRITRIILRTGQPGQAPERDVITSHDINDYKEKSELTSQKLFSCILATLRSYRDIMTIEQSKRGLESIIRATHPLFRGEQSIALFAQAVPDQIDALLHSADSRILIRQERSLMVFGSGAEFMVITGSPEFQAQVHRPLQDLAEDHVQRLLKQAIQSKRSSFGDREYVGFYRSRMGIESALYLRTSAPLTELDRHLLEVFSANITLAFDNIILNQDIIDTQKEILYTIGDVIETRSHETANHVNRVARLSEMLGRLAGLSDEECELLHNASPMHDLGKIGIPDEIMTRPGNLEAHELVLMRSHTTIGHQIMRRSKRRILQTAATIALEHHENWDGSGYPSGLAGENINLYARITAIMDVYDSLSHDRVYKPAWPPEKVFDYISKRRGTQFDPRLTDFVVAHWAAFEELRMKYPDSQGSGVTGQA